MRFKHNVLVIAMKKWFTHYRYNVQRTLKKEWFSFDSWQTGLDTRSVVASNHWWSAQSPRWEHTFDLWIQLSKHTVWKSSCWWWTECVASTWEIKQDQISQLHFYCMTDMFSIIRKGMNRGIKTLVYKEQWLLQGFNNDFTLILELASDFPLMLSIFTGSMTLGTFKGFFCLFVFNPTWKWFIFLKFEYKNFAHLILQVCLKHNVHIFVIMYFVQAATSSVGLSQLPQGKRKGVLCAGHQSIRANTKRQTTNHTHMMNDQLE